MARARAKIDEELRRRQEGKLFVEIGAISSGLAHDLRSSLQTIRNCTHLLLFEPNQEKLLDARARVTPGESRDERFYQEDAFLI